MRKVHDSVIQPRPNANPGLWAGFLLPLCILASIVKHNVETSKLYLLSGVLTLGILYTTTIFIIRYKNTKCVTIPRTSFIIPFSAVAAIYYVHSEQGIVFSLLSSLWATVGFFKLYIYILKRFPLCFTYGEGLVVSQAAAIFLYSSLVNVFRCLQEAPRTTMQISTLTVQVGLLTVLTLMFLLHRFPKLRSENPFYILLGSLIVFLLMIPLQILIRRNPILWIFGLLTRDFVQIKIFLYWSICTAGAVITLVTQVKGARKASNVVRKTFHVLAVLIFVPGMLYECGLLYLASGVAFGAFVGIETTRLINLPVVAPFLEDGFSVFRDEKDVGSVALTPMYLLVGVSFPLWVHPAPCDLTDSVGFNLLPLLSGVLTIGVGDSAASYLGALCGRHFWKGSVKTIEGTLGCILFQGLFVFLLTEFGFVDMRLQMMGKVSIAILVSSIVEAKTTQVDNLILPMVMYLVLIL